MAHTISHPSSFIRFPDLPLELRLMVWDHALSGWTVLASAGHDSAASSRDTEPTHAQQTTTSMIPVGPAPYLAGFACVESWRLMKQSYTKLTFRPRRECTLSSVTVYWVNMDRTVLCLDASPPPVDVLRMVDQEALMTLQNIVLRWNMGSIGSITRACQLLATLSPALQTIVIQTAEDTSERTILDEPWLGQSMTVATAAYYSTIPGYEGPELAFDRFDCAYLRAHLLEASMFSLTPPKVHILPPISNPILPPHDSAMATS